MLFWNSVGFSSFYYKVGNGEIIRFRQHLFGDENFMKKEPHVKEEAFLRKPIERVSVPYKEGLDDNLVQERIKKGWVNYAVESPEKTNKQIVKDNIFTYFNMIFLVLSMLLIIAGSYRSLTFLPIIIANTLVGIIQEIRAKNILSKMKMLNAPYAQVVRNGEKVRIPSRELVIDDIVMLSAGNQICADAEVVHGEIHVNEALLTGESDEIEGRFLSNVMKKAIPGGVADVFAVGALVFCGQAFHLDRADISTAATLLLSVVGFMVLNKVCQPMNMLRRAVWIGNMLALVFTGIFMNHLFALEAMSLECILLFIMFSFAAESFLRYLGKLVDWCYSIRSRGKRRRRVNKGCSAT